MPIAASAAEVIDKHLAVTSVLALINQELEMLAVKAEVTYCEPSSNSALRFDIGNQSAMGRLTWWQDGSIVSEALRVSDGASLSLNQGVAKNSTEAAQTLLALAGVVSRAAS